LRKYFKYIVILLALFWQTHWASAQDTIPLNTAHSFKVTDQPGYTYQWWYTDAEGNKTFFTSTTNTTEEIVWNTEGDFNLFAQAKDANNCLSEIITKKFVVIELDIPVPFVVYAGPDTTISSCQPYIFADVSPVEDGFKYIWSPAIYLDNPAKANPVFIPGKTTTYELTVTNLTGETAKDTVTITVEESGKPTIEFITAEVLVEKGNSFTHEVNLTNGNPLNTVYRWSVEPASGTSTNLSQITGSSASIVWDGFPGGYTLYVSVADGNGCVSDTISQHVEVAEPSDFYLSAGRDTTIGSCQPYQLQAEIEQETGITYSYLWSPATNLDNPSLANPLFTPGGTTTFVVTVTSSKGDVATDSVKITVSEVIANAGSDIIMVQGSTAMLDGTGSLGEKIIYQWTTNSGMIENGANTAKPVVSGFGDYYLLITDSFGCTDHDIVNVSRFTQAPVAVDDYDTTSYQRELVIDVLANDIDADDSINPSSLIIANPPHNGTAYVDFDKYVVHYSPDNGFKGTDVFEYRICNTNNQCDDASVFVLVTDFNFMIPNAFSPNGDGINDYFEILGIEFYENNSISIINRWGNKVYEAKGYGVSSSPVFWDGKSNTGFSSGNNELPTGTYYYILDFGDGQKPISGSIYLDR
jgi:gliding motility-associated-like protein